MDALLLLALVVQQVTHGPHKPWMSSLEEQMCLSCRTWDPLKTSVHSALRANC